MFISWNDKEPVNLSLCQTVHRYDNSKKIYFIFDSGIEDFIEWDFKSDHEMNACFGWVMKDRVKRMDYCDWEHQTDTLLGVV